MTPEFLQKKPVILGHAFYSVTAVLGMLALCIGIGAVHEGWYYGPDETVLLMCAVFGLTSLLAIAAYYLTERLWKRSVFVGLLMFVVFLGGFGISGAVFIKLCLDSAHTNTVDFGVPGEYTGDFEADQDDYYDDYYEEYEGYYEEDYDDYDGDEGYDLSASETLSLLCDEDEDEYVMFDSALEYFNKETDMDIFPRWGPWELYTINEGFSHLLGYGGNAFRRIASHLFNNSPQIVMHILVDRFADNITKAVSMEEYDKKYRRTVDLFLVAYDDLLVKDDDSEYYGTQRMLSVYGIMQRECPGGGTTTGRSFITNSSPAIRLRPIFFINSVLKTVRWITGWWCGRIPSGGVVPTNLCSIPTISIRRWLK
ncbi:MAG: hypothetical protein LUF90_06185 [Rikenellaceae bacterium]|nr:hypothetical protein [Rikenellaceae bacterium]